MAIRVPAVASTSNNGPGHVIRGDARNGWAPPVLGNLRSPVLSGSLAPPVAGHRPAVPYGGVTPNSGGVTVNPSYGVNYGPVVRPSYPSSPYPPPDTESEWYRRYRDRGRPYPGGYHGRHRNDWPYGYGYGYGYGPYGPVFVETGNAYYYAENVGFDLRSEPMGADDNGREDAEPERPAAQQPADRMGALREDQRKDRTTGLTDEKLHELMIEGVKLFEAGKYNEAAAKFLRVTLADRQNVDATLAYAVARFATGDYQIAGLAVRRSVRRMPEVVDSTFDVRTRYTDPEQFQNHLARLEQYVLDHPGSEDAWTVLGFIRHFSDQRELAVETFRRLQALPDADKEVADIFLSAKPAEAAAQTRPAEAVPMVPAAHDRPLPEVAQTLAEQLITVEAPE